MYGLHVQPYGSKQRSQGRIAVDEIGNSLLEQLFDGYFVVTKSAP